eukprot:TRINITY_DN3269_c0_g1_i1.p4 TRINITY_DN3269_c0_g1~~TRINITY_DN3269_c0_g1_i1.p4  ORF type:complete len:100 (-),score=8.53 TRINITY_DN3269_c0_g1_i1:129-428(-)
MFCNYHCIPFKISQKKYEYREAGCITTLFFLNDTFFICDSRISGVVSPYQAIPVIVEEPSSFTLILLFTFPMYSALIPCLLYTSPSPRDLSTSRMPSSA